MAFDWLSLSACTTSPAYMYGITHANSLYQAQSENSQQVMKKVAN